jgi:hypothetical protein
MVNFFYITDVLKIDSLFVTLYCASTRRAVCIHSRHGVGAKYKYPLIYAVYIVYIPDIYILYMNRKTKKRTKNKKVEKVKEKRKFTTATVKFVLHCIVML